MNEITFGEQLESQPGEIAALTDKVRNGKLMAANVRVQPDGDVRLWDVDPSESPVLQRLMAFARANFEALVGEPPARAFIMVNYIDASRSPTGSGGGWHRDSFRMQYKAFSYLTDVDSQAQGPLCIIPASNKPLVRLLSALYWLGTRGNRYSDDLIRKTRLRRHVVLAKAGVPFFVNTSLIHRGLPIVERERIAATVYMYRENDKLPSEVVRSNQL